MASPPSAATPVQGVGVTKCGWVEKYSVGRGFFPVRNWKKRWLMVTHQGLNYAKGPNQEAQNRTYVPFIQSGNAKDGVKLRPVFLFPVVTAAIHPEATEPSMHYFGLRFEETDVPRILLLRTPSATERDGWVRFIGQFVHAASLNGVPISHPMTIRSAKPDPEELDGKAQMELRKSVMEWDDGFKERVVSLEASVADAAAPVNWESDDELSLSQSPRTSDTGAGVGSNRRPSQAHSSPQPQSSPPPEPDDDCL